MTTENHTPAPWAWRTFGKGKAMTCMVGIYCVAILTDGNDVFDQRLFATEQEFHRAQLAAHKETDGNLEWRAVDFFCGVRVPSHFTADGWNSGMTT